MRSSIVLLALAVLVPSTAFADGDAPAAQPVYTVIAQPNTVPAPQPAPPPVVQRVAGPDAAEQPLLDGYLKPHIVPYLGGSIPSTAHIETRPNWAVVGSGVGILALSYSISLFYALGTCGAQMDCRAGSGWLYVPIVGPFITAAQAETTGGSALAAFDGSVQVIGAALAIGGIIAPKKFVVWQDKAAKLTVAPTTLGSGTSAGLAVTLTNL